MKRLLVVPALVVGAWLAVAIALFVVRHDDRPMRADAVVVLQGSDTRLPLGYRLVQEGYAPLLVVSRGSNLKLEDRVCGGGVAVRVVCFRATSTTGEAAFVAQLARQRRLRRLDVVTSQFHVFRTRLLFERCYHGELRMIGSANPTWRMPWLMVTETAKLAYQLAIARGC